LIPAFAKGFYFSRSHLFPVNRNGLKWIMPIASASWLAYLCLHWKKNIILKIKTQPMKTITLYLLFAFTIGVINAQTQQVPVNIAGNGEGADYSLTATPPVPDAVPADQVTIPQGTEQLTMAASPNPFKDRTLITCSFQATGKLTLEIRNMFGETVKSFEDNVAQVGDKSFELTSERLRPGIYTAMLIFKTSKSVMIKTIRIVYNQ
jgi:hypothetical protein